MTQILTTYSQIETVATVPDRDYATYLTVTKLNPTTGGNQGLTSNSHSHVCQGHWPTVAAPHRECRREMPGLYPQSLIHLNIKVTKDKMPK